MMQYVAVIFVYMFGVSGEPYIQEVIIRDDMVTCERAKDAAIAETQQNRPKWTVKGVCQPVSNEDHT